MWPHAVILIYSLTLFAASCLGGWLPSLIRLTHTRMQLMISFVAGVMLGVALFVLIPHAIEGGTSADKAMLYVCFGLLTMFLLVRALDFHQHAAVEGDESHPHQHDHGGQGHAHQDHQHRHGPDPHPRDVPVESSARRSASSRWRLLGMTLGLALHSLFDGVSVAAVVLAENAIVGGDVKTGALLGLGPFLAVLLHKPLDSLSISTMMAMDGFSKKARVLMNLGFGLICPLGALIFVLGAHAWGTGISVIVGPIMAFCAGVFLCISLEDLLPELQFHRHDRFKLSAALLLGVALAFSLHHLEAHHDQLHQHGHSHDETNDHAAPDKHDHD